MIHDENNSRIEMPEIFKDWEHLDPWDKKTAKAFEDAIIEVSQKYAQPFNDSIKKLPNYRVSKLDYIHHMTQKNEHDLIPRIPPIFKETSGADFNASKICASGLD